MYVVEDNYDPIENISITFEDQYDDKRGHTQYHIMQLIHLTMCQELFFRTAS